jgi:hypothetical protein
MPAHLVATAVLFPHGRQCLRCRKRALRGRDVCAWHAGGSEMRAPTPGRLAGRRLHQAARLGLIPAGLEASEPWRGVANCRHEVRAPIRLGLLLSWDTRDTRPAAFLAACRAAHGAADRGWRWDKHGTPKGGGGRRG